MSDIVNFPGARLSPEVLLHQILESIDEVESIVLIRNYKDGTSGIVYSQQSVRLLAFDALLLQNAVMKPPEDVEDVDSA